MGKTGRTKSASTNPARRRRPAQGPGRRLGRKVLRCSLWGLGMVGAILATYALTRAMVRSPLFGVERIELDASGRPGPDEIRRMSGIRPGMNLLSLDPTEVSQRLEGHPWIQNATVVKRFPDRVLIKVRKKGPVAVAGIQGRLYYMAGDGTILDKLQPGEPLDFPMITGLEQDVLDAGRSGEGRDAQQALSLLRALQATPTVGSVSEIHVDRCEGLSFFLEGFPSPVYVGWSDFSAKIIRFAKILPSLASQPNAIERVDLRFSRQIVVRQREAGKPRIPGGDGAETRAGSAASFHPT